ncbi:MAG: GNAT family N-acetyltransferase [Candidatus ainarchaeum sp.]|nr:GNAT family N-acetyltransferase [Candidatus ainarchaeum sp.]
MEFSFDNYFVRQMELKDLQNIVSNAKDPEIANNNMVVKKYNTLAKAKKYIEKMQDKEATATGYELVIEDQEHNFVGVLSLHHMDYKKGTGYIGYWLTKSNWGKGIATKALKHLLPFAFDYLGLKKIYAKTLISNTKSQGVLERAGFKVIGKSGKAPEEYYFYELNCK